MSVEESVELKDGNLSKVVSEQKHFAHGLN
jgi:hypothetical protein